VKEPGSVKVALQGAVRVFKQDREGGYSGIEQHQTPLSDQAGAGQRHQQHRAKSAAQATANVDQKRHDHHIDKHTGAQLHACVPAVAIRQDQGQPGAQQIDAGQRQMPRSLVGTEQRQCRRIIQNSNEEQRGDRKTVEIEVAERLPVCFGEELLLACVQRAQHRRSDIAGLGFAQVGSTAVVAIIGQNALADRLIDTTKCASHHALFLALYGRAVFAAIARSQRLAPDPPQRPDQSDQE
jgi:hypothetical protein